MEPQGIVELARLDHHERLQRSIARSRHRGVGRSVQSLRSRFGVVLLRWGNRLTAGSGGPAPRRMTVTAAR